MLIHPAQMRFSQSTCLLMSFLIKTETISNNLTQIVNCPTRIPTCDSYCPALLDMFISSDSSICSTVAFLSLGKSDHVFVSAFVFFPSKCRKWYHFLLTILVLIGMVFVINQKMFLESLSLIMLLLQLLLNFVSGSRLELMYISLIINIRLNLIHSHGF